MTPRMKYFLGAVSTSLSLWGVIGAAVVLGLVLTGCRSYQPPFEYGSAILQHHERERAHD